MLYIRSHCHVPMVNKDDAEAMETQDWKFQVFFITIKIWYDPTRIWLSCNIEQQKSNNFPHTVNLLNQNAFSSCHCMRLPWKFWNLFLELLDRKSKTCFFTFLNVYASWNKWDEILISQLSPPKFRNFADQNGPKSGPHENEFWQFSNAKISFLNS